MSCSPDSGVAPSETEHPLLLNSPAPAHGPHHESPGVVIRRTVTAAILFIIFFLFIRTMMVEPFGVPTGSMAPTLIGDHRETVCPRCQHPIVVGEPSNGDSLSHAICPNCSLRGIDLEDTWVIPGDRLLVDKNVFNLRSPRRWEIAVFRCPVDLSKPYVKRMIGLPGEAIQLIDGDVYANGILQRKSLAQLRELRIPVFDLAYAPPATWRDRWLVGTIGNDPNAPSPKPADESVLKGAALHLDAMDDKPAIGLTYVHWNPDRKQELPIDDWLAYNGPPERERRVPVHDFIVTFDLEVQAGSGTFALRLADGLDTVRAEFPIATAANHGIRIAANADEPPAQTGFQLQTGKTYRIEFAFADRRALLAIDGASPLPQLDLPATDELRTQRGGVSRPLQLGAKGVAVAVRNLRLWRDVHYRGEGSHAIKTPHQLADDEYFACGDNSANSQDSRAWAIPGIPERDFIGKPFLIHQPLKAGRVNINNGAKAYQTVDWDRLRWVR